MLVVFLNNKLITADTIAPMVFELGQRHPECRVEIICFGNHTLEIIRRNVVIHDALAGTDGVHAFGGTLNGRLPRLISGMINLARLTWLAVFRRAIFLHFKALNSFPMKILYLVNRRRTYFCQSGNVSLSATQKDVLKVLEPRKWHSPRLAAGALIGFDQDWPALHDERSRHLPRFVITAPFHRAAWKRHLEDLSKTRLEKIGISFDTKYVVVVLSSLDRTEFLRDADGYPALFEKTLRILTDQRPDLTILVKPHPATSAHFLELLHRIIGEYSDRKVVATDLHPQLLAAGALAFIANSYSSVFDVVSLTGVPTVEFTDYSGKALAASGGGSIRPQTVTRFFNADDAGFRRFLCEMGDSGPASPAAPDSPKDRPGLYDDVLDMLAGHHPGGSVGGPAIAGATQRER